VLCETAASLRENTIPTVALRSHVSLGWRGIVLQREEPTGRHRGLQALSIKRTHCRIERASSPVKSLRSVPRGYVRTCYLWDRASAKEKLRKLEKSLSSPDLHQRHPRLIMQDVYETRRRQRAGLVDARRSQHLVEKPRETHFNRRAIGCTNKLFLLRAQEV
jgi:hypothetical protein